MLKLKVKPLTERELWLVDRAAAELQEELMETIRTDIRKPWFVIFRAGLLRLAIKLKRKGK